MCSYFACGLPMTVISRLNLKFFYYQKIQCAFSRSPSAHGHPAAFDFQSVQIIKKNTVCILTSFSVVHQSFERFPRCWSHCAKRSFFFFSSSWLLLNTMYCRFQLAIIRSSVYYFRKMDTFTGSSVYAIRMVQFRSMSLKLYINSSLLSRYTKIKLQAVDCQLKVRQFQNEFMDSSFR